MEVSTNALFTFVVIISDDVPKVSLEMNLQTDKLHRMTIHLSLGSRKTKEIARANALSVDPRSDSFQTKLDRSVIS